MSCKKVVSVLALGILAVVPASAQTYTFNHADYATGIGPQTLAIGDFNGDGVKDIVTGNTNSSAHTVSVLLGKRDGTLEPNVDYAAGGAPSSVAVGDFNGDGKLDIIVVYGFENASVGVLLGNGDGTFKPVISTTAGPAGESIAVGDFNGDKKLDIAIADNESPNVGVDVMLGNGDGTFKAPVNYPTAGDPRMVVVADLNGDKKLDLATVNSATQTISVLLGTGSGSFGAHTDFNTAQSCISLAVGDLRRVSKIDIVAGCQGNGQVEVLLANGDGTFQTPVDYMVPAGVDDVAVGDFSGDGKLDVAVTNAGTTGMVSILTGTGTGTLNTAVPFGTNFSPTAVAAADFNGDGKLDLVTADDGSPFGTTIGSITVLLSNGASLFGGRSDYSLTTISTSGAYNGIAAADLNGDGKVDLVVPVTFASQISVLMNKGNGTFDPFVTYSLPTGPNAIALGDFNNDKKADVVIVNSGGSGSISILLNSGTGTFPTYTQYNINGYGNGVAVGDFNKDGNLDIVATDLVNDTVSVLLGNGTGAFPSFTTYATGTFPYGVTVADLNGDGWLDLAVANQSAGTVSILLNKADGSGTFLAQKTYSVGGSPLSIAAGKFRGTGKPVDLAVATNNAFGGIVILPGNGDGTYGKAVPYNTLNNAYGVVAGDFNNDGKLDLAVSIVNPGTFGFVTLMLGNGDGTFGDEETLTTGTLPYGIVAADFNKDGGLDLATGNGSTFGDLGSATVLLNSALIGVTPAKLAFGTQKVGTTSAAKTVTVSNPGATPLRLGTITTTGDFAQTNSCPASLKTGTNCTIDVTFSPTVTGVRTGTLTIPSTAKSSPRKLALSGTGD